MSFLQQPILIAPAQDSGDLGLGVVIVIAALLLAAIALRSGCRRLQRRRQRADIVRKSRASAHSPVSAAGCP